MSIFSKTKKPRLKKKISFKEKVTHFFYNNKFYFIKIGVLLIFILVFSFLFFFTPPVESGQYYNHFQR